ncbi:hypothetical protein CEE36_10505 [candidate division TA06 bacterium B3_TA06]|uniref:Uncharacterized protein n=1 Tax=candidate division TA06 bacterium B3_TA06 TaxID=2012487 RepID=A0A532UVN5_UNCT6|nr:MAG: hypothetical protein CEE36_10505 [candidate division TA06 bacterium B3_TA06]
MKKQLLLAAGFAVIMLFSCKKEEEPPTAKFWPLAEGNQWTTTESYSWDVTLLGSDSSSSQTTNTVKASEEREDGKMVWPVETSTDTSQDGSSTIISRNYYYVTEDSIYIYSMDKNAEEPTAVEPNNLEVGTEWDGNLALPIEIPNISTDFPAHFKVIDQGQAKVPAGTFDCLIIQIDLKDAGVDSAATQWRAENVGIVKLTTDFQTQYAGFTVKIYGTSELESINFEVP